MTQDEQSNQNQSTASIAPANPSDANKPNASIDAVSINEAATCNVDCEVKQLDVAVNKATLRGDIRYIYSQLFPDHDLDKLVMKELTEGAVNCMYKCYVVDQFPVASQAVIVRLFNFRMDTSQFSEDDKSLQNRDLEFASMCQASKLGICAKVYARFKNGIVYQFLSGETLNLQQVHDIEFGRKVAIQVARLHTLEIQNNRTKYRTQMERMALEAMPSFETMFADIQTKIDKSNIEEYKFLPKLKQIDADIQSIEKRLVAVGAGDIAFCHNDLNLSNILYDAQSDQIKLLDFEWGEQNPTFVDIAVHFTSFAGFFLQDYDSNLLPSDEYQRQWIRTYLIEFNRLKNRSMSDEQLDQLVEEMWMKVIIYMQVVKLNYAVRAPIWDFKDDTKEPNKIALYCLKSVTGYRFDKDRCENLLRQLEEKAGIQQPEVVEKVEN